MSPVFMTILLLAGWGTFAWSARRRWKLMTIGAREDRFDKPGDRFRLTLRDAFGQVRMRRYPLAGVAHFFIFYGFIVLLLRSLILWGRGFHADFNLWFFGLDQPLGRAYSILKDVFIVLVIAGTLVFVYYRVVKRLPRMTLSTEGLIILGIILAMMFADLLYDGASTAAHARASAVGGPMVTPREFPGEPNRREVIGRKELKDANGNVLGTFPTSTYRDLTEEELAQIRPGQARWRAYEPAGSAVGVLLNPLPSGMLAVLMHVGFWTHSALVLIFLNLLPYSKHFHIITAVPNVYLQERKPARLRPIEDIDGKLERGETLGIRRIDQFSWKAILDFYTCTECGRCSEHCPATNTGKKLSPKHFTLDLRDFLYARQNDLIAAKHNDRGNGSIADGKGLAAGTSESAGADSSPLTKGGSQGGSAEAVEPTSALDASPQAEGGQGASPHPFAGDPFKDLVPDVIAPEVLWACTTCRACEQECPVFISYVDKIVDMRRYLVQEKGEFASELQEAFRGLETNANPWNFPSSDRAAWAEGLEIKTLAENPDAPVLFWVGCMPSFDERAKKVARATATLMKQAGVDFAILGQEETCTGDPARRAGNEYLFQMMARQNVEVLNNYGVAKKTIVTTCPHCFNTLLNEYPDFGGTFNVVHHTTFLAELLKAGKLRPQKRVEKRVVFHDSCYLGRYNEVYDAPRQALRSIPGLTVLEPKQTRDRGMCCGAGGAQMFKEEEHGSERVNIRRTEQLLATNPDAVSSACPFCQRMLTDGLAAKNRETIPQLDIAELLLESTGS